jgi:hypothetical protein
MELTSRDTPIGDDPGMACDRVLAMLPVITLTHICLPSSLGGYRRCR